MPPESKKMQILEPEKYLILEAQACKGLPLVPESYVADKISALAMRADINWFLETPDCSFKEAYLDCGGFTPEEFDLFQNALALQLAFTEQSLKITLFQPFAALRAILIFRTLKSLFGNQPTHSLELGAGALPFALLQRARIASWTGMVVDPMNNFFNECLFSVYLQEPFFSSLQGAPPPPSPSERAFRLFPWWDPGILDHLPTQTITIISPSYFSAHEQIVQHSIDKIIESNFCVRNGFLVFEPSKQYKNNKDAVFNRLISKGFYPFFQTCYFSLLMPEETARPLREFFSNQEKEISPMRYIPYFHIEKLLALVEATRIGHPNVDQLQLAQDYAKSLEASK